MRTPRREAGPAALAVLLAVVAVLGGPAQAQTVDRTVDQAVSQTVDQARAQPGADAGADAGAVDLAPQQGVVPAGKPAVPPAGDGAAAPGGADAAAAPETAPDPEPDPAPATAAKPSEEAAPQAAPETAPEPVPEPASEAAPGAPGATPGAAPETAPEPAADTTKPSVVEPASKAAAASGATEATPAEPPRPQQLAETDLDLGTCLGRLEAFGTVFERGRPVAEQDGACGIVNPVRVTEIVPGVTLSPQGIMRCETAAALAAWVSRFALPASAMLPDRGRLTEVTQGSAYICRGIGKVAGANLSEHAYGNAIDIMAFRFASGAAIAIEPREREGTPAEAFQRTVRAAACLGFTTVLGPGEEEHDDHLHLDIKERDSGYRLCQ